MSFENVAFPAFFGIVGLLFLIGVAAAFRMSFATWLLDRAVEVRPNEVRAMLVGCLYFFCTLASYFILRPIRDAMAVASGVRSVPWLFAGTLTAMIAFHPVYSSFVARFPVKRFVAITYGFFAANLLIFFALWQAKISPVWTGRVFFVWLSVFNLFVVSVFWSVMVDTFRETEAKRLFGFIGLGGTIGSVSGSAVTAYFAQRVGTTNLLLVSAALLVIASSLVAMFPRVIRATDEAPAGGGPARDHQRELIGGSVWSGILSVFRTRYIAGIAIFMLLYTVGSTFLYSMQTGIIGEFFKNRDLQTTVLARMELVTQLLAGFVQAFITARAIRIFGLPVTLSAVAIVSVLGFTALGASAWGALPLLWTFLVFNVVRRASDFSLTNPSRKILFTVLSREDKYKSSSFIETSVYRLGDQLGAWGYAALAALGLSMTGISWVAAPMSVVFLALAVWLARQQQKKSAALSAAAAAPAD